MTNTLPRFPMKEVREHADWLIGNGWQYDGLDSRSHFVFYWPVTGATHTIPGTPSTRFWRQSARTQAARIMGVTLASNKRRNGHSGNFDRYSHAAAQSEAARREQRSEAQRLTARIGELAEAHDHMNQSYETARDTTHRTRIAARIQGVNREMARLRSQLQTIT